MPDRLGVDYWRERAKEARAQASDMRDEKARRALLGIVENYEELAAQAEAIRNSRAPLVEPSSREGQRCTDKESAAPSIFASVGESALFNSAANPQDSATD
jgi:hypothetical protein